MHSTPQSEWSYGTESQTPTCPQCWKICSCAWTRTTKSKISRCSGWRIWRWNASGDVRCAQWRFLSSLLFASMRDGWMLVHKLQRWGSLPGRWGSCCLNARPKRTNQLITASVLFTIWSYTSHQTLSYTEASSSTSTPAYHSPNTFPSQNPTNRCAL